MKMPQKSILTLLPFAIASVMTYAHAQQVIHKAEFESAVSDYSKTYLAYLLNSDASAGLTTGNTAQAEVLRQENISLQVQIQNVQSRIDFLRVQAGLQQPGLTHDQRQEVRRLRRLISELVQKMYTIMNIAELSLKWGIGEWPSQNEVLDPNSDLGDEDWDNRENFKKATERFEREARLKIQSLRDSIQAIDNKVSELQQRLQQVKTNQKYLELQRRETEASRRLEQIDLRLAGIDREIKQLKLEREQHPQTVASINAQVKPSEVALQTARTQQKEAAAHVLAERAALNHLLAGQPDPMAIKDELLATEKTFNQKNKTALQILINQYNSDETRAMNDPHYKILSEEVTKLGLKIKELKASLKQGVTPAIKVAQERVASAEKQSQVADSRVREAEQRLQGIRISIETLMQRFVGFEQNIERLRVEKLGLSDARSGVFENLNVLSGRIREYHQQFIEPVETQMGNLQASRSAIREQIESIRFAVDEVQRLKVDIQAKRQQIRSIKSSSLVAAPSANQAFEIAQLEQQVIQLGARVAENQRLISQLLATSSSIGYQDVKNWERYIENLIQSSFIQGK